MKPFPNKKYNIIYADPPWPTHTSGPGWNSNQKARPNIYPLMSIEHIIKLPVKNIAEKNAHLYLWTINRHIVDAYAVALAWGFKPRCLLTYCKTPHGIGLGGTFIQTTEHLLFCRRGILTAKRRVDTTWFHKPRMQPHSTKPEFFRELIVSVSGDLPRIELFARGKWLGWDVWGDEA